MNTITSSTQDALLRVALTTAEQLTETAKSWVHVQRDMLVVPFDMAREQYTELVKLGVIENSMLASAKFNNQLKALEEATLGPLARGYDN